MKKTVSILLALFMVFGLAIGCSPKEATPSEMTVCVGPYPDTIDPALNSAVDGATYIIHAFSGLVGYRQNASGNLELFADCAKELPTATTTADGKTQYVFELKDDLKWSDGTPLTAADFIYAWNRAASPVTAADYGYMFDVIDGYSEIMAAFEPANEAQSAADDAAAAAEAAVGTADEETTAAAATAAQETADAAYAAAVEAASALSLNVTASEDGKTLTVVLPVDVPYFMELCAFPAYMPVKQSVVDGNESWATAAETYISNGPYKVTEFTQAQLVMEKNENYYNADAIKTDKLVFPFNDDDSSLLANYQSGAYLFIDSVPNDEIETLKTQYPDEFVVTGQLGTYYICFNINDAALSEFTPEEAVKIRTAMSLLIDRNYIVNDIGKVGQVPAAGFVAMGLTEPDGSEYISKNGYNGDGTGYYSVAAEDYSSNCDQAITLLKEVAASSGKFTVSEDNKVVGFPELSYIFNTSTGHQKIAEYLQAVFGTYGFTINVSSQEWGTFLNTRKNGDYSIARNGWLGDYNDPISFLDMWTTNSGNNDTQFGRDANATYAGYSYNGQTGLTWAESYDVIIAAVKASKDPVERFALMHQAENLLMSTGCICPLYYYTDIYMISPSIDGFFASPLGFKYFMYASVTAE
ncbi:MAG TPA: peptide ABC transporter substrate-binding protein [Oscillospiraceae bacterium]|nr:peptide ABC transporter substrate-binding protein [Oscillospiraceae bacterium]HPF55735.1 peptide ABC transporter substrate-binding protein [Clostridiales bacterium]HPK34268.1 peptide ABC transporter substrate-binding protein [Oscillospiraceae bacterium]HPR74829.1 peptide ABC transporter substrate-binding protein [Oscillospiraceae bacterium]